MKARGQLARQSGSDSVSLKLKCEDGFGSAGATEHGIDLELEIASPMKINRRDDVDLFHEVNGYAAFGN
jgi:hypothetical protein